LVAPDPGSGSAILLLRPIFKELSKVKLSS
jgi:hypothetical protein